MNRKLIWGIPIAMVVLGLAVLLISRLQPHFTAAVTDRGAGLLYTRAQERADENFRAVPGRAHGGIHG